jgi:hypothetical protein
MGAFSLLARGTMAFAWSRFGQGQADLPAPPTISAVSVTKRLFVFHPFAVVVVVASRNDAYEFLHLNTIVLNEIRAF